jgi:hypothetical protein
MRRRSTGFQLRPNALGAKAITAAEAAQRLGVSVGELEDCARGWYLEPTYSIEEVAAHLGCQVWQVNQLVRLGLKHGQSLHPTRGGFHPTFKPSHKSRRIPLSAIERHKRHMAKVHDGVAA